MVMVRLENCDRIKLEKGGFDFSDTAIEYAINIMDRQDRILR